MAALRQEHRYGLSCGKINKNTPNQTLYHVKLTDTAIRTLEAYQNLKYVKIPAPSPESPNGFRVFSFYLSSDSKDKPQSSFDCIHQYVSGEGRDHLEGQGSIQDKITVCATDDSYQTTRERMSQVEKDIWSRSAIEIKPGPSKLLPNSRICVLLYPLASVYVAALKLLRPNANLPASTINGIEFARSAYVKEQRKKGLISASDSNNKHSPSNKRSLVPSPVAHRPLKDRIIHLLALKPYRKPELLLWLERERASPKDKVDLTSVLDEVGRLNLKDHSYSLKDELYRHVQRDWPGYQGEEKQLIHRLLLRCCLGILLPLSRKKRPLPLDSSNSQTPKKQRLLDQCLSLQSPSHGDYSTNGACSSSGHGNSSSQIKIEFNKTNNHLHGSPNGLYSPHKLSGSSVIPKLERTESTPTAPSLKPPHIETSICTDQQLSNGQHKKKKSKKHKDKERECLKPDWIETSPDLKQNQENLKDHEGKKTPVNRTSPEELPDYLIKYSTVTALEQRKQYKDDFCAEYDEYRALHDRISAITEMFVQLGSKINTLSPGTQEYKLMEDQILQKYRKYKKKFPGYREEKKRCEYLHQKLSHIKGLITDYDRAQELS
ncbi:RNA polymerase II elongation factor ELL Eleven-nineteen lysine-rich leukemia protein [Channa argus]|uniref:RNA polymerase II elongation factor ELL Eleven-nineteen lysine-rich leukemia protein n=1 Tax=Channa argus TaxID=215402 RepID=A0A6G1PF23_CHAAH|nr:RNA polymerase II elongation factor ELL Eleven-nineteen lysine-rich leukemia protein [Channa argus]